MLTVGRLVSVEQHIKRATACHVRRHLPAELICCSSDLEYVLAGNCENAPIVGVVITVDVSVPAIRFAQVRCADQYAAIHHDLQRSNAQPIITQPGDERQALDLFAYVLGRALSADAIGDKSAHGHLAASMKLLICAKAFRPLSAINCARDADAVVSVLHALERP